MLSPIGVRGSSDAYGSWKMICIRRRYGLSAAPLSCGDVRRRRTGSRRPSASMSRSSSRPTVVLPQPDSPTRPSVSPRRIVKLTPSTAWTVGDRPLEDAAADREVLHEVADLDERRRPSAAARRRRAAPSPRAVARTAARALGAERSWMRSLGAEDAGGSASTDVPAASP